LYIAQTIPLEDAICPKCGKRGQKKHRRRYNKWYVYFDHYRGKRHITYVRCCYIGKRDSL